MGGQDVGLYDSEEYTFWFVTRDEAVQLRSVNLFGSQITLISGSTTFLSSLENSFTAKGATGNISTQHCVYSR